MVVAAGDRYRLGMALDQRLGAIVPPPSPNPNARRYGCDHHRHRASTGTPRAFTIEANHKQEQSSGRFT